MYVNPNKKLPDSNSEMEKKTPTPTKQSKWIKIIQNPSTCN